MDIGLQAIAHILRENFGTNEFKSDVLSVKIHL